jgi:hypothetical protein
VSGFTGNVLLKTAEGIAEGLFGLERRVSPRASRGEFDNELEMVLVRYLGADGLMAPTTTAMKEPKSIADRTPAPPV